MFLTLKQKAYIYKPKDYTKLFNSLVNFLKGKKYLKKIISKSDSLFMNILAKLMFFCPGFMYSYTTTIGNKIYFSSLSVKEKRREDIIVLAHEALHLYDYKRFNILFYFLYLFPQSLCVLALLAFLAFINLNCLWFLLFLIFLLPFPAPWRTYFELRAYIISFWTLDILTPNMETKDEFASSIEEYFTKKYYYFMCPSSKIFKKLFNYYFYKFDTGSKEILYYIVNNCRL